MIKMFAKYFGVLLSFIFPKRLGKAFSDLGRHIHSGYVSRRFKRFGGGTTVFPGCRFEGEKYISLGDNVSIGRRTIVCAYPVDGTSPEIIVGDNTDIGGGCHISAIDRVFIGNNVVFGEDITVTDNSHGNISAEEMDVHPFRRPLASKGPVKIGDYVWVGDKVTILPGVTIGKGSVVGAGSVVTKNVPERTVAVGNPAKVVRRIE